MVAKKIICRFIISKLSQNKSIKNMGGICLKLTFNYEFAYYQSDTAFYGETV